MNNIHTRNLEETQKIAKEFAENLNPGEIICLYGNLGVGKTTFVQAMAKGLGITKRILSPTFVIIRKYELKNKKIKNFYHVDLYRLSNSNDVGSTGLLEIMKDKESVVAIEWAEKMGSLLPEKRREIKFEYGKGLNERFISLKNYG